MRRLKLTKIKVETSGDFIVMDPTNAQVIEANGATEVEETAFVTAQIELGNLKVSKAKDAKAADTPAESPPPSPPEVLITGQKPETNGKK